MSAIRVRVRLLSLAHGARRVGALTALAPWVAGGVELRAQSATAHSASWTVAPPRVVVGTAPDGVDRFLSIAGATALPGGTIVVVDRDAPAVVFIGPDGRVRRRVGRSGSGPGEYRSPELIGACAPGRVFVFDRMQQRVTVLDTAGRVERSQVLTAEPAALACHARSGIALMRMPQGVAMPDANGNAPPLSTRVLMLSPAFDSLGASPAFDAGEARPMGRIARIAVGPSGFFVGTQQSPQIARYSVAGVPRGTVRAGVVGRAPTRAHQDAVIEQLVAPMAPGPDRQRSREILRRFPMPATLPPYSAILADDDDVLWVVTSAPGDARTALVAIDAAGVTRARITLEGTVRVLEVGREYVLGARGDAETCVEELVVYALRRGEAP